MTDIHQAHYFAIIPAAGKASRMNNALPKQYLKVQGKTILEHSVNALLAISFVKKVIVVIAPDDRYWSELPYENESRIIAVQGGGERQESVLKGLKALNAQAAPQDWILVHDAARPCLQKEDVERLISTVGEHPVGGILGSPVRDTLKKCDSDGQIQKTIPRQQLWQAFTPQMFRYQMLCEALSETMDNPIVTDEASAMELSGFIPRMVPGRVDNIKLTFPEDMELIERYFACFEKTKQKLN